MPRFSEFLQSLRQARGLSQQQLAMSAGCATRTVTRAEAIDPPSLSPANASAFLRALHAAAPLTPEEQRLFLSLLGLDKMSSAVQSIINAPVVRGASALLTLVDTMDDEERATWWRFAELIEFLGVPAASAMVDAAGLLGRVRFSDPPPRTGSRTFSPQVIKPQITEPRAKRKRGAKR